MGFLNSEKLIVGYDLGNKYSQISYATSENGDVETLSQVAGTQKYNIPTVLCKRYGANQWFYGREALRYAEQEQGILVENLLELALDGEPIVIEGGSYEPVALLALFFKRSLSVLSQVGSPDKFTALMISCPTMDEGVLEVLHHVVEGIHMKADRVTFQGHAESFYSYMLRQPKELWAHPSILFDHREESIKVFRMECNRRTTPKVVYIEEREYPFPQFPAEEQGQEEKQEMDIAFCRIAEEACDAQIGNVFLIGDWFGGNWMKFSLRFLCKGRRVFQGNNLFSKGACCGMQERLAASEAGREHVFLGKDKLKANIGMKVLRRGEDFYCALLDAGVNWYEAEHATDIYIQDGNELMLTLTPLIGKGSRMERIGLEGFQESIARLRLHLFLEAENRLAVEVYDLGFGDFRPPSGRVWKQTVDIY